MRYIQKIILGILFAHVLFAQSLSFQTYVNPVIPGDHPDPTLTRIGNDYYTSGSSFNPTPKIYHSTDLVHWEVIAQPVSPSWSVYGDGPGEGIWGGHMVYYGDSYWHFFARGGRGMFYVKADAPEGPWSDPVALTAPSGISGIGQDNSIFIDDNNQWYLLVKNGQAGNYILELSEEGQPNGRVLNLTWLNPAPNYPYGWAEGPVMWKHDGYYFYSFAQHLVGDQYVMRSDTLTDEQSAWTIYNGRIYKGASTVYNRPNHIAPVVTANDGTSWTIAHSYHSSASWYAQCRQGLLCQVFYDANGFPYMQYPVSDAVPAPALPSSGIPFMVPKSDDFNSATLNPVWSFLGYITQGTYSLEVEEGWLYLEPYGDNNTVIQTEGEHTYSMMTRVNFEPASTAHEAGLWIINGPETLEAKVFSTRGSEGTNVLAFSFNGTRYEAENTIGPIVWLKMVRKEHVLTAFFSADGRSWTQIGGSINAAAIDQEQTTYNDFTGNQQGLYVKGQYAFFDCFIYRDAYTPIPAANPANQLGTTPMSNYKALYNIHHGDWALYAGVQFGNDDYSRTADSLAISASSETEGNVVEVWLDSLDTGTKIAECPIGNTGGWTVYETFLASLTQPVSGSHDVYLKFLGAQDNMLYRIEQFYFFDEYSSPTSVEEPADNQLPGKFSLGQNYPNPFNPVTQITYSIPKAGEVTIDVFDVSGREIAVLSDGLQQAGDHVVKFDGRDFPSGVYVYQIKMGQMVHTKKMILMK